MQTSSKLFISCFFCLSLTLLSGCGGGNKAPKLTPVEQAEVDKIIAEHGKNAILGYLMEAIQKKHTTGFAEDEGKMFSDTEEISICKYLQYFVSQGADVNAKDDNGSTPLHFVSECGSVGIVKFLVSKGADVNAKNGGGATPLHFTGNVDVAKIFVSKGADVNAKSDFGTTPLDNASRKWGAMATVEYLESIGGKRGLGESTIEPATEDTMDW